MSDPTVFAGLSVSLDGFVAGPNDGPHNPLGDGGERLHEWGVGLASWRAAHGLDGGETGAEDDLMADWFERAGAFVMGRRMFDAGEGPWGDEPPFRAPVFVLTSRPTDALVKGATTFTFVGDGIEDAVARARGAASGRDVAIAGGAHVVRQCLRGGLLDELTLHVPPVLLGGGVRLFDDAGPIDAALERTRVLDSPRATHMSFRVVR